MTVLGVTPCETNTPLLFLIVKLAPEGLLERVTGYFVLLTMLAQAVRDKQTNPKTNGFKASLIIERREKDFFVRVVIKRVVGEIL